MRKLVLLLVGFVMLISISGCDRHETNQSEVITRLYIAHAPDESTENTGAANEWFRAELEAYLGIEVVHLSEVGHVVGIEAMRAGHLDIMFASAFSIVSAQEVIDIEIAGTLNHSEVNPLNTLFITNNDDIHSVEDLNGHSFAFVSAASASGYFFPAFYLIQNFDLASELIIQPGYFFSATSFSGSHETSIVGVSLKDYDAAAVLATVFRGVIDSGVVDADSVRVIGQTPPSPDSSYIMRADLPDELKNQIRSFFRQLDNEEYFMNAWGFEDLRFIEGNYATLDEVRLMMEILEMDN